jgi:prepilin-type N-terminal cleavage/methylation domain-containing protein
MSKSFRAGRRTGFTLVELLVVIAIIGILVAMLLPAIQAAREAARRIQCSNNQKQIGVALHNYHDVHLTFPPDAIWMSRNRPPAATSGEQRNFTWVAMILPFMEQAPLHAQINFSLPAFGQNIVTTNPTPVPLHEIVLKNLLCPSDTPFKTLPYSAAHWTNGPLGMGYMSYAGNAGWDSHRRLFGDERLAGVFPLMDSVAIGDIRDGTSNVIMVGETTMRGYCCRPNTAAPDPNRWKGGTGRVRIGQHEPVFRVPLVAPAAWTNTHQWIDLGGGPLLRMDGNAGAVWGTWNNPHAFYPVLYGHYAPNVEWPTEGSNHPSGVLVCLADGSVKFVKDTVSNGGGINPAAPGTPAMGDAYGRWGNIWAGMHEIQKIANATPYTFEN